MPIQMPQPYQGPGQYIPPEDVTATLPDGRTIQIAVAGHPMDYRDAVKAGLVGPSETKEAPKRPAPAAPPPAEPLPAPVAVEEGPKPPVPLKGKK